MKIYIRFRMTWDIGGVGGNSLPKHCGCFEELGGLITDAQEGANSLQNTERYDPYV